MEMARNNRYAYILKYIVNAELNEPLHIGGALGEKTDILVHSVDNIPFIQASSIAGMLRDYAEKNCGREITSMAFGSSRNDEGDNASENGSRLVISDGMFKNEKNLLVEYRPHVAIDSESGSAKKGALFNMEYIGAGADFRFEIVAYTSDENNEQISKLINSCLAAMNSGEIQLGGKKSTGCGFAAIKSVYYRQYKMTDAKDRKEWTLQVEDSGFKDILPELVVKGGRIAYRITVEASPESDILVKSVNPVAKKKEAPDQDNIRNAAGEYIVPGSSVKGVLRHRVGAIAEYLKEKNQLSDAEELVRKMFGAASDKDEEAITGNVIVRDAIIENARTAEKSRIHVDKFTGGAFNKGLFKEEIVSGTGIKLRADVINDDNADRSAAMLILAFRDLAIKAINLGSGFNVGRGFIDVNRIVLEEMKSGEQFTIDYGDNAQGNLIDYVNGLLAKFK